MLRLFIVLISGILISPSTVAQKSVLASGQWFKIGIERHGVYRLSYNTLKDAGLLPENIDPRKLQLYGNGSGMLPQRLDSARQTGLGEHAIWVEGGEDGSFDEDDYIIFYGQGPYHFSYSNQNLEYQHHLYSKLNYYYLTVGDKEGLRVTDIASTGTNHPKIYSFNDFAYYEQEQNNLLTSGREWYSERYELTTAYDYTFRFPGLKTNTNVTMTAAAMAQSFAESSFSYSINGTTIGTQPIASVPDFENPSQDNPHRYSIKGRERTDSYSINSNKITGTDIVVRVNYEKNSTSQSVGFLNYLLIEVIRNLALYEPYTTFRSVESIANNNSSFEVNQTSMHSLIWDITTPEKPQNQLYNYTGNKSIFGRETSEVLEFVVFNKTGIEEPPSVVAISNQNLSGINTPDLLIVSAPEFITHARRLAHFRTEHDQLNVAVVTPEQIYNEFSSGKQDITAIRNFVKYLYDKGNLQYLLLFGRGSYDYKDVINNNTNFVPIYQSRNSLHPLDTYASDDYYGFLEAGEGAWMEINGGNHSLDIGIGRLPVTTTEQASQVVDKIINYSSASAAYGPWRNEVIFVADDEDGNLHQRQAEELTIMLDSTFGAFEPTKLYMDAFPQEAQAGGETSPKAKEELVRSVEEGALIVNYTGHGSEANWMQEQVLDIVTISQWDNYNQLPLFVTATCEFGRHDNPRVTSGGEMIVTNPNGGGVAIVSTCRPVNSSSNFALNRAFYQNVFKIRDDGTYPRLGDVIKNTKNQSIDLANDINKVGNRNFSLLGDPSLRLAYPQQKIIITNVSNTAGSDTLRALDKVTIEGEIHTLGGVVDKKFTGTLYATVYDKASQVQTLGNDSAPFQYRKRQNYLYNGLVTVSEGLFRLEFIVTKNISQQPTPGKIVMYAQNYDLTKDANGAMSDLKLGGSNPHPMPDTTGPEITLFIGDTLNTNLSQVGHNTMLVARLFDESGINISGFGVSNSITASLDGQAASNLNAYYLASKDNYTVGYVHYPLQNLSAGEHTIVFKAWDVYNNSSEQIIKFTVANPNELVIHNLINYPNPVVNETTFEFKHNRAGEDLEVNLKILSRQGQQVLNMDFEVANSFSTVELYNWILSDQFGQKLNPGLYIFKLGVRSKKDGAKNQKYQKLIIVN